MRFKDSTIHCSRHSQNLCVPLPSYRWDLVELDDLNYTKAYSIPKATT